MWTTWTPMAVEFAHYWNLPVAYVDALLSVFMFTYVTFSFLVMYLLQEVWGLARFLWWAAIFNALGALLRWMFLSSYPMVFVGSLFAALSMAFVMSAPPLIAAKWFGEHERATATAIGALANQFGGVWGLGAPVCINFVKGTSLNIRRVETYLLAEFLVSLVGCIMIFISIRTDGPPTPPNLAEALKLEAGNEEIEADEKTTLVEVKQSAGIGKKEDTGNDVEVPSEVQGHHELSFTGSLRACLTDGLPFVFVFGLAVGSFYTIPAFISQCLTTPWSLSQIGWLGIGFQLAGCVGSFVMGQVVDRYQHHSMVIRILIALGLVFVICFLLANWVEAPHVWVILSMVGVGFCLGGSSPVGMEFAGSITYPANEATVVAVLVGMANLVSFIFVTIGGWMNAGTNFFLFLWVNLLVAFVIITCTHMESKRPMAH